MLTSVEAIVDALGGTVAVSAMAGVTVPAVLNWKSRRRIPAERYFFFSVELAKAGKAAPDPAVFGFHSPANTVEARA